MKPLFSDSVMTSWYLYLSSARLSYSYLSTLLLWAVLCWQFLPYVQRPSRPFLSHKSSCNAAPAAAVAAAAAASHWCGRKSLANKKNKSQIASNRIELNRYCGCCPIVPSLPQRVFRSGDLTNYATATATMQRRQQFIAQPSMEVNELTHLLAPCFFLRSCVGGCRP